MNFIYFKQWHILSGNWLSYNTNSNIDSLLAKLLTNPDFPILHPFPDQSFEGGDVHSLEWEIGLGWNWKNVYRKAIYLPKQQQMASVHTLRWFQSELLVGGNNGSAITIIKWGTNQHPLVTSYIFKLLNTYCIVGTFHLSLSQIYVILSTVVELFQV